MAEIGSTLREARMRAHIDITEVEAHTKIRAKYLRAIENEEWDLLPGTVYVKSFLRTYGDYLGLDSRLLIDEFKRRYERPDDHEVRQIASIGRDRERERSRRRSAGSLLTPRVVIVAALVVIVAALYAIGSHSGGSAPTSGITPAGSGHRKTVSTTTDPGRTTPAKTTATVTTTTTPVVPATATLALVPTGKIWVCVKESTGKLLIPGLIYDTGDKIPTESGGHLLVNLGNANVTVTVNGKPYALARSAQPIGLNVTAHGATVLTTAPTCG